MPLGTELDLEPNVIVLGPQLPLTKKRAEPPSPIVGPCLVAKRLDRSRWHLACSWVLVHATLCCMGTQLPSPKGGQSPQFSAHFYCDQTAGCIKMPLGMAVGLSPGGFVLDGDPAHCLHVKFHLDPPSHLATTHMGRKLGGGCAFALGGGAGSASNTTLP